MKKNLILIGSGCWFIDSFSYFIEKGFKMTVIKVEKTASFFAPNYEILNALGAKIIEAEYNSDFIKSLNINQNTIIIGGGYYSGDSPNFNGSFVSHNELWLMKNIANYNKQNNLGALTVRYFNGDTGFGTKMEAELFEESLKNVDLLIFDNDNLRDFVVTNAPKLKDKKYFYGWIETPLKKYVNHNLTKKYFREFISFGRVICSDKNMKYPVKTAFYPYPYNQYRGIKRIIKRFYHKKIRHLKSGYYIAGCANLAQILSDRKEAFQKLSDYAFGLSHFYDIFQGSIEKFTKNKDFYFSLFGQNSTIKEGGVRVCLPITPFAITPQKM